MLGFSPNRQIREELNNTLGDSEVVQPGEGQDMGSVNRKATEAEMAHARQVIRDAFPEFEPVFGGHSSYGGHRAPRDHTISFRLRDRWGKYHSSVIWILPQYLASLTVADVRAMVAYGNWARTRKKRKKRQ